MVKMMINRTKWASPPHLPNPSLFEGLVPLCAPMCGCKAAFLGTSCASCPKDLFFFHRKNFPMEETKKLPVKTDSFSKFL